MATYSAYFDESTSASSSVFVVAGFLSTDPQWSVFKSEWMAVLDAFGVKAFHAQHFAKHKGEFHPSKGWDEPRRRFFMAQLLETISKRAKLGFGTVVHQKEFLNIFVGKERTEIGSVYNLACTCCHLQVGEWAKANYQIEPIGYFFDAGHKNAGEALRNYQSMKSSPEHIEYRMGSIAFDSDEVFTPLQASDLAAYELWRWLDEHFGKKTMHGRYPLQEVIKIPWVIREFDKSILEEMRGHRRGEKINKRIVHHVIAALRPGHTSEP